MKEKQKIPQIDTEQYRELKAEAIKRGVPYFVLLHGIIQKFLDGNRGITTMEEVNKLC